MAISTYEMAYILIKRGFKILYKLSPSALSLIEDCPKKHEHSGYEWCAWGEME